jgi:hypothetical protein
MGPERRVVVSVDMESYSKRSSPLQHRAQTAFRQIMEDAAAAAGLNRVDWKIQQGGDGELGILPLGTSERAVLRLVPALDELLREHNEGWAPEARVRLRVAVHQGLVHLDGANGFPGDPVVDVSRLIDAPQLKETLRAYPGANVALIVSESIFREVVRPYRDLRPDQFAPVTATIPEKNFSAPAWIYVPGENVAARHPSAGPPVAGATPAESPQHRHQPPPSGSQVFHGINAYGPASFGNHNSQYVRDRTDEPGPTHGR